MLKLIVSITLLAGVTQGHKMITRSKLAQLMSKDHDDQADQPYYHLTPHRSAWFRRP